jgi:pimeloyl-ACP methyl ester carboxylesterase
LSYSAAWPGRRLRLPRLQVNEPIGIPEDQLSLPGGSSIPQIANDLGFAFATTSYRVNGLAVRQGLDDVVDLVEVFSVTHGQPSHVYLVGASAGGIITALAMERHADVLGSGLAACGPLVTLHTLADPIIPYWHEPIYRYNIWTKDKGSLHTNIPVLLRYGHCNFSAPHVLLGFVLLVYRVTGSLLLNPEQVLPTSEERDEYRDLAATYGLLPGASDKIYLPVVLR